MPEVNLSSEITGITEKVIGSAFKVINGLGSGFLEKVYENALAYELRKSGLKVKQQWPIQVHYDEMVVGEFAADLFVGDLVVVELKTVKLLDEIHMAQCINYLRATHLEVCLLINFYRPKLEYKRILSNAAPYFLERKG
jgi:GxxExxY protein